MSARIDMDWNSVVADIVASRGDGQTALIPILQDIQLSYGYVPAEAQMEIAKALNLSGARVSEVISFYSFLTDEPQGKFVFRLCQTISCEMKGKEEVGRALESALGISFGETSEDGLFSLEFTNCIGMCDQPPAMLVNDDVYGDLTPEAIAEIVADYRRKGDEL